MTANGKPTSPNELILWDGTKFYSGKVNNANIDPSATVDGSKISPSTTSDFGTIVLANDLGGTGALPTVVKIQNNSVAAGAPSDGYSLVWNGLISQWVPKNIGGFTTVTNSNIGLTGGALQAANITSGATTLTVSGVAGTSTFTLADVGKAIQVVGAGASGADLFTTIASFTNSTTVDLTVTASTTVIRRTAFWYPVGQDDTATIQTAINNATENNGIVYLPSGVYVISSTLTASLPLLGIMGDGMNSTYVVVSSQSFTGDMLDMSSARGYHIHDISFKHAGLSSANSISVVTAWSITSNVATLTGTNNFSPGQQICITGFTGTGNTFNDQFVTITSATGSDFSFAFTHVDGSGSDNGVAYLDYNCIAFPITSATLLYTNIYRVQTMNAPGVGVKFALSVVCRFEGCVFLSNRAHGVALYNSQNIGSTSTVFENCYSNGNGLAGYYLHIVNYSSFRTCAADSNGISYYMSSCKNVTFEGCGSEATVNKNAAYPGYDYYMHGGQGNIIDGCYMSKNSGTPNAGGTYIVFDNTASQTTVRNPVFAGQLAQLPTNVFTIASGCSEITIWEPFFNNNLSTAYTNSGTDITIYIGGTFVVGGTPGPFTTSNPLVLGSGAVATTGIIRSEKGTTTTYWYAGDNGATADIGLVGITSSGSLTLGDGNNINNINLNVPSANLIQLQTAGSNAIAITLRAAGSTSVAFASTVTSATINQASTSASSGATMTVQAQGATGASNNGGLLALSSGTSGSATVGNVLLQTGGTTRFTVSPTSVTLQSLSTGVVHADSSGVLTSSTIVNTDVSASAAIDVSKLSNGTAGQFLIENSGATAPTWTTISGDISASTGTPGQLTVNAITGGVSSVLTVTNPIALTTGTVATAGNIRGPNATTVVAVRDSGNTKNISLLGSTAGGSVVLGDGVNATNVNLNVPSANLIQFQSAGNNAIVFTVRDTGGTTQQFASTVTSATINQANLTTNNVTAATMTIQAQNETGTTSTGGALALTSGTGTTKYGDLSINGPMVMGLFTQAMADTNQTVSAGNSIKNIIVTTGANTTTRALTLSCSPTSGAFKFVVNNCTGSGITVQFITGAASATINAGSSAIVYGDGTNAIAVVLS